METFDCIKVSPSPIHGNGIFSTKVLPKGFECRIHGYLSNRVTRYCFEWDDNFVFEPYPPFKYINHSDSPNCEVYVDKDGFHIKCIRKIQKGEELTIDYGP